MTLLKLDANPQNTVSTSRIMHYYSMVNAQLYTPLGLTMGDIYRFKLITYKYCNAWKNYRFFMGFPTNGQRTWSNAKASKKRVNEVRAWEEYLSSKKFKFICPPEILRKLCHMEFLNRLWNQQWHHE
jgi:hypothetical protein